MKIPLTFIAFVLLCAPGCTHLHAADDSMQNSRRATRIKIRKEEASEGEKLNVVERQCSEGRQGVRGKISNCHTAELGEAVIIQRVDDDTVIIELPDGLEYRETLRFEDPSRSSSPQKF